MGPRWRARERDAVVVTWAIFNHFRRHDGHITKGLFNQIEVPIIVFLHIDPMKGKDFAGGDATVMGNLLGMLFSAETFGWPSAAQPPLRCLPHTGHRHPGNESRRWTHRCHGTAGIPALKLQNYSQMGIEMATKNIQSYEALRVSLAFLMTIVFPTSCFGLLRPIYQVSRQIKSLW